MQLTPAISTLLLFLTSLTSAAPQGYVSPPPPPPPPCSSENQTTFGLIAIRSASPIHYLPVVATRSGLQLNYPQDATCASPSPYATFLLDNSTHELFLYNGPLAPAAGPVSSSSSSSSSYQQLYTDRSGMGQGVLRYTLAANQTLNPNRIETRGWAVAADGAPRLRFDGADLIACPAAADDDASWSVWTDAGVAEPGFNEGCLGFAARVVEVAEPVRCVYS